MSISADVQTLAPGKLVDLFELDATSIEGGSILRWCNHVNELGNDVVWNGDTYTRLPIEADGFQRSSDAKQPRPMIRVANVAGVVGALARDLDDLVGAKVIRRRTFVKYLDAVNFTGGVNPTADPSASFDDEVWYIDRKASENGIFIEFELSSAIDLVNVQLPRRKVLKNLCWWDYRSAECSYAGPPVATINDAPTTDPDLDRCGKRVASCRLRFGDNAVLPWGGFAGVDRN